MIVKPDKEAVADAYQIACRAVRVQILNFCVLDLTVAMPTPRIHQRGFRRRNAREASHVVQDNLLSLSVLADFAAVEPDPAGTEVLHRRQIVRYEENGAPPAPQVFHGIQTLLLKSCVSHSEHFIDNEYVRIEMRCNSESQPQTHSGRVPFYLGIDELLDPGEVNNGIEAFVNLLLFHTEDRSIE